jgi:DnaK suppressor protein
MQVCQKMSALFSGDELSQWEIDSLKLVLEGQKKNLVFKQYQREDFNIENEERSDDVDHANADKLNFERLRFRTRENFYERKIDDALKRIESGEYGLCKECRSSIGFMRLKARPTAELCLSCKEESEKREYGQLLKKKSRSFGESCLAH